MVMVRIRVTWSVDAFGVGMAVVELAVSALVDVRALGAVTGETGLALALVGAWNIRVKLMVMVNVQD